jgi:uncharacterized protein YjbI with pentapeptide repeats
MQRLFRTIIFLLVISFNAYPQISPNSPKPDLNQDKLHEEIRKLKAEVTTLEAAHSARWAHTGSAILGALGGFATAVVAFLVYRFGNAVQTKYTETQDNKLKQDVRLQREAHNLDLFRNLASDNSRMQLAAAAVLLQRLEAYNSPASEGWTDTEVEKLERSAIVQVLLSVLKEKPSDENGNLRKLIADNLVRALGAIVPDVQHPSRSQSILKAPGWDFQKVHLVECWWKRVDARGVDFFGAEIRDAGLAEAFLAGATLYDVGLQNTVLRDADLQDADLRRARLSGTVFDGANLKGAKLQDATYNSRTRWPDGFNPEAAGARLIED